MTHDANYNMPPGSGETWRRYDAADDAGRLHEYDASNVLLYTQHALDTLDIAATEADEALVEEARAALVKAVKAVEELLYRVQNGDTADG